LKSMFRKINQDEFLDVYKLMQQAFPPSEYRTYEDALNVLSRPNYNVFIVEEKGVLQAFIAEWEIMAIKFVEHFAVSPEMRGQGLGTKVMRAYLGQTTSSVVIEVEAEDTLEARRRIAFYKHLNFALSDIEYKQPLLQKTPTDILLRMMHYPAGLSDKDLYAIRQEVFKTVYQLGK